MCVLFRHKIVTTQFFPTDTSQGALGYVQHQYNQKVYINELGTSLSASAYYFWYYRINPFNALFRTRFIFLIYYRSRKTIASTSINVEMVQNMLLSTFVLLKSLFTIGNLLNPSFWLFLFIAICISAHIALSKPDIKGSIDGVIVMFIVLFLFNIIAGLFQYDSNQLIGKVMKYNMYLIAFSSVALLFSCISTLVSFGFINKRRAFVVNALLSSIITLIITMLNGNASMSLVIGTP